MLLTYKEFRDGSWYGCGRDDGDSGSEQFAAVGGKRCRAALDRTAEGGCPYVRIAGLVVWRASSVSKAMIDEDSKREIPAAGETNVAADLFYAHAMTRIRNFMLVLAPALAAGAWWKFGFRAVVGFVLGCVISYLNFHWLKSGVSGLADRATHTGKRQSGTGLIARFLFRYILLGAASYAILTSFPASLRGLFAGLFLPVGAIACEAVYELYAGMTRGV
jgi:hypothetical protein